MMRSLRKDLKEKNKRASFKNAFDEERELAELSVSIAEARDRQGISQQELSEKAAITQQQLSKIESGSNCNIKTLLKVCHALGMSLRVS